jgi:fructose-specific phosphotransferase system IIC component
MHPIGSLFVGLIGTVEGIVVALVVALVGALVVGLVVYGVLSKVTNIILTREEKFIRADLNTHSIASVNRD